MGALLVAALRRCPSTDRRRQAPDATLVCDDLEAKRDPVCQEQSRSPLSPAPIVPRLVLLAQNPRGSSPPLTPRVAVEVPPLACPPCPSVPAPRPGSTPRPSCASRTSAPPAWRRRSSRPAPREQGVCATSAPGQWAVPTLDSGQDARPPCVGSAGSTPSVWRRPQPTAGVWGQALGRSVDQPTPGCRDPPAGDPATRTCNDATAPSRVPRRTAEGGAPRRWAWPPAPAWRVRRRPPGQQGHAGPSVRLACQHHSSDPPSRPRSGVGPLALGGAGVASG